MRSIAARENEAVWSSAGSRTASRFSWRKGWYAGGRPLLLANDQATTAWLSQLGGTH